MLTWQGFSPGFSQTLCQQPVLTWLVLVTLNLSTCSASYSCMPVHSVKYYCGFAT